MKKNRGRGKAYLLPMEGRRNPKNLLGSERFKVEGGDGGPPESERGGPEGSHKNPLIYSPIKEGPLCRKRGVLRLG